MSGQPTEPDRCPVCGEPFESQLVVQRGDRWGDLFPGSPLDIFAKYRRWCTARYDVLMETQLRESECAVYLHDPQQRVSVF